MIYLDTHVAVRLYTGPRKKFGAAAARLIDSEPIYVSPMVVLELRYLFEIERLKVAPHKLIDDLKARFGLIVCDKSFPAIVDRAVTFSWTRDPFDRVITAHAMLDQSPLVTIDESIRANYSHAVWD